MLMAEANVFSKRTIHGFFRGSERVKYSDLRNFSKNVCSFPFNLYIFLLGFLRLLRAPHARGVHDQIFSKKPKNWRHTHGKKDDCV